MRPFANRICSRFLAANAKVTVGQVAREALSIETPRIGTADQRRIAAAMERLGLGARAPRRQDQLAGQTLVGEMLQPLIHSARLRTAHHSAGASKLSGQFPPPSAT
jgi:hypothetical protein